MPVGGQNLYRLSPPFRVKAFVVAIFFCSPVPLRAQQPQIDSLAEQAETALEKARAKKVVVLDFSGPGLKVTQLGRDLADQFAEILAKSGGKFVVVDRTKMLQTLSAAMLPLTTASDLDLGPILEWTHADAEVIGHLEVSEDQISLAAEVRQFKKAKTLAKFSEISQHRRKWRHISPRC